MSLLLSARIRVRIFVVMRQVLLFLLFCSAAVSLCCDRGLAPPPPDTKSMISGKVYFSGRFPPCDSSRILAIVLVEAPPPYTPIQLVQGIGNATVIPFILDSCAFRDTTFSFTLSPKIYRYLGVAQHYGSDIAKDWRVVGFVHTPDDSARVFDLKGGDVYTHMDMYVRFDSLVRQPFIP